MPRKKKGDLISLAKKTNDASLFTTRELLSDILEGEIPDDFKKCICILCREEKDEDVTVHKFSYYTAGFKSRFDLLGVLKYIEHLIIDELEN